MKFAIGVQSTDYLILRGHVQLLHDSVQFLAQFDILSIKLCNLTVFLREQEFQILHLILRLAALGFPLEVGPISVLPVLDQLKVQIVVLFDDPLIFVLQWRHRLSVQLGFVCNHSVIIFQLLEGFSCL